MKRIEQWAPAIGTFFLPNSFFFLILFLFRASSGKGRGLWMGFVVVHGRHDVVLCSTVEPVSQKTNKVELY